ncbi:MAG: hypothetical protein MUE35_11615 [Hydrogenophaga sp.]|jgi:hypothetical protein|nr:hypothetical protein [Hydrogenophaga sp.]
MAPKAYGGVRQPVAEDAAVEAGVEFVMDEPGQLRLGAGFGAGVNLAATCCTGWYSVGYSMLWRSSSSGAPVVAC